MYSPKTSRTSPRGRKPIHPYFEDIADDQKFTHSITDRPDSISHDPHYSFVRSITSTGNIGLILDKDQVQQALLQRGTKNSSIIETIHAMEQRRDRKDRRGKPIRKGYKKHRITFKDEVLPGEKIASVVIVDSYKQYNQERNNPSCQKCCRVL